MHTHIHSHTRSKGSALPHAVCEDHLFLAALLLPPPAWPALNYLQHPMQLSSAPQIFVHYHKMTITTERV